MQCNDHHSRSCCLRHQSEFGARQDGKRGSPAIHSLPDAHTESGGRQGLLSPTADHRWGLCGGSGGLWESSWPAWLLQALSHPPCPRDGHPLQHPVPAGRLQVQLNREGVSGCSRQADRRVATEGKTGIMGKVDGQGLLSLQCFGEGTGKTEVHLPKVAFTGEVYQDEGTVGWEPSWKPLQTGLGAGGPERCDDLHSTWTLLAPAHPTPASSFPAGRQDGPFHDPEPPGPSLPPRPGPRTCTLPAHPPPDGAHTWGGAGKRELGQDTVKALVGPDAPDWTPWRHGAGSLT